MLFFCDKIKLVASCLSGWYQVVDAAGGERGLTN
jgi:hypothetical protein